MELIYFIGVSIWVGVLSLGLQSGVSRGEGIDLFEKHFKQKTEQVSLVKE